MTPDKIQFPKEKETMLMTLHCRAIQSQWKEPILHDPWAEDAMQHVDYDIRRNYSALGWRLVGKMGCTVVATRAATFDLLTTQFLADHPHATVLHVGCGMDSRVFRVNPPGDVQWYDVDYPDVVDLRRRLLPDRSSSHLIGASLEDLTWLSQVPRDQPTLLLAEGVLMYLGEAEVKALLTAVAERFPGGQMVFDVVHPMILKSVGSNVGGTGATYRWSLNEPQDIKLLEPKLELIKEYRMHELVGFSRFALPVRTIFRAQEIIPALRRMNRIVVYRYQGAGSDVPGGH